MPDSSLTAILLVCALALSPCPVAAQDRVTLDGRPKPNWVFNGEGQKTDQVKLVDASPDDALYPINLNNNWGLMNQAGNIVVFPRYDWTDYNFEGFSRYVRNGRTGFLIGDPADDDDPNEFFIFAAYDYADRFNEGCAVVMNDGKWGMIDKSRKLLLPMQFDGVLRMQDGFAAVEKNGKCGFINRAGKLVIPLQYKQVRSFHNGLAAVQDEQDRWGYINKTGKIVWQDTSGKVTQLGDFHEDYARIQGNIKGKLRWGFINKRFAFSVSPTFTDARDFHFGMAAVKTKGKWGFITETGRWAIEPQFDDVDDFDDLVHSSDFEDDIDNRDKPTSRGRSTASTYAMVQKNGRWGYINRVGQGPLVTQFKEAQPFFRGLARVSRDDSFAYILETGKVRFDPRVAIEQGIADLTTKEDGRASVARKARKTGVGSTGPLVRNIPGDNQLGNQVYEAPAKRKAVEVPYPAEHLYSETLPMHE